MSCSAARVWPALVRRWRQLEAVRAPMLVERNGFAGGFFTAIVGSAFNGFVDELTGTPVVGGLVFEILERMGVIDKGQGPRLRCNVNGDLTWVEMHPERVIQRCDPERFKRAADAIPEDTGVGGALALVGGGCGGDERTCRKGNR